MNIGFDAKRAFHNHTGLGNYARQIINDLHETAPENKYFLYTPSFDKNTNPLFRLTRDFPNTKITTPEGLLGKLSASIWRSNLGRYGKKHQLDIFHGLSNELPSGFKNSFTKKIVTIHDVIFARHPEWYSKVDAKIYHSKTKAACKTADKIIAISERTKQDLIELYQAPAEKIKVIYQSCHRRFLDNENIPFRNEIIQKYKLERPFILFVGTLNKRKNSDALLEAYSKIAKKTDHDLIMIGSGPLKESLEASILDMNLMERVRIYSNFPSTDLPPMYQLATYSVAPSSYEGFGIPIIESLSSKTPVLYTKGHCFEETAGKGGIEIESLHCENFSEQLLFWIENKKELKSYAEKGLEHVQQFSSTAATSKLLNCYQQLL